MTHEAHLTPARDAEMIAQARTDLKKTIETASDDRVRWLLVLALLQQYAAADLTDREMHEIAESLSEDLPADCSADGPPVLTYPDAPDDPSERHHMVGRLMENVAARDTKRDALHWLVAADIAIRIINGLAIYTADGNVVMTKAGALQGTATGHA